MKRVVITGMGTVNPLGNSVPEFFENVKANKKMHRADKVLTEENNVIHNVLTETKFMKEIMKLKSCSEQLSEIGLKIR